MLSITATSPRTSFAACTLRRALLPPVFGLIIDSSVHDGLILCIIRDGKSSAPRLYEEEETGDENAAAPRCIPRNFVMLLAKNRGILLASPALPPVPAEV